MRSQSRMATVVPSAEATSAVAYRSMWIPVEGWLRREYPIKSTPTGGVIVARPTPMCNIPFMSLPPLRFASPRQPWGPLGSPMGQQILPCRSPLIGTDSC